MAMDANDANKDGWHHHWKAIIALYKRRKRLYSGLSEARTAATAEHLLLGHLAGLRHCWSYLEPNPAKPPEAFAQLLSGLCSADPEARTQTLEQLEALLEGPDLQEDSDLQEAVETALRLAMPIKESPSDSGTLFDLIQSYTATHSWLSDIPWPSYETASEAGQSGVAQPDDFVSLLTAHQVPSLKDRMIDTPNSAMVFGLASRLGDESALDRLLALENEKPEWVLPAYWLASTRPALERLLSALSDPRLAPIAAPVWQVMSGQALDQEPALGVAGKKKKTGPLLPNPEPAAQWWDQHSSQNGPWLDGKPVTAEHIESYLTRFCGNATLPVWWLWQFEKHKVLPNMVHSWHRQRVAVLRREATHGTG
ncbi:hypothetical protein [Saccharospirillum salsuginis]|uniref:Uncharacterized protein n=1 Tax=Saccharospirillum salsuginis TaxID=418750 RepID=A0A918N4L4_9GAMM|nr:hypothetical protein [Saccharospirillum salsuginis]GGX38626.1 hypothetical protein GCM10007392_01030 [Saccharospirillum salsuginis]